MYCPGQKIARGIYTDGRLYCECNRATEDCDGDGYSIATGDCNPEDNRVSPSHTTFMDAPRDSFTPPPYNWDWNCDGKVEKKWSTAQAHQPVRGVPRCSSGWHSSPSPGCGETATWVEVINGMWGACDVITYQKTQTCK